MAKRKTIEIEWLKEKANHFMLHSADKFQGEREGVASLLESALHETGNYRGFGYLYEHHMEKSDQGKSFGIIFDESPAHNHQFPDSSRRFYL